MIDKRVVKGNLKQAVVWLKEAADANLPVAQYQMALLYLEGKYLKKSREKAMVWLEKAAKNRFKPAEQKLNVMKNTSRLHGDTTYN